MNKYMLSKIQDIIRFQLPARCVIGDPMDQKEASELNTKKEAFCVSEHKKI